MEAYIHSFKKYDKEKIHESISNLIFTDKNVVNINKFNDSINEISDYVKANEPKEVIKENLIPTSILATVAINKFNQKYSSLDEEEKTLLKVIMNSDEKFKHESHDKIVNECMALIDSKLKHQ